MVFISMQFSISDIPCLFLLLIPGYITVEIVHRYGPTHRRSKFDTVLYSILYSFVISILYSIFAHIIGLFSQKSENFLLNDTTLRTAVYLILGVALGFAVLKVTPTKFGNRVLHVFNKNLSTKVSARTEAMKNSNGAWVTVYMKNGIIYTGQLIYYADDLDEKDKDIMLTNYRMAIQTGRTDDPKNFCKVIVDNADNPESKVYLQLNNIISTEIVP